MKISVLIPVYNAETFLREALDSVLIQTYPVYEIVVFNDGSRDGSGDILSTMKGIRYIESPHVGVAKGRNILVRESRGDWIAFMDADDLWEPDKLEKQVHYLEEHPECDIVTCAADTFLDSSVTNPTPRQKELVNASFPYLLQSSLVRKSLMCRFMFNEQLSHGSEDTDWFMRVSGSGIKLHKIMDIGCHYRIHSSNMSLDSDMRKGTYLRMIAAAARAGRAILPDLSVIIPAYNAEKYLRQAIESVLRQTMPEELRRMEILVIDDGSADNTAALAESIPQVKCIRGEHRYASAARNTGIRAAKGRFLLFLDADDVLADGAVKALWKPFENRENIASFGLASDFISEELDSKDTAGVKINTKPYKGFFSGCALVRRSVFEEGLWFDETLKSGETVDWRLRFKEKYPSYKETETVTVYRRIHLTNTGRRHAQEERKNYAAILRRRMKETRG